MSKEIKYHELQKSCDLSNSQAATYLGVNERTIRRYRSGKVTPPKAVIMCLNNYFEQLAEGKKK